MRGYVSVLQEKWQDYPIWLLAGLTVVWCALFGSIMVAPEFAAFVPIAVVAGAFGLWTLIRLDRALFVAIVAFGAATQASESGAVKVLLGAYLGLVLLRWFVSKILVEGNEIARNAVDWAVVVLLLWVIISLVSTLLHGGDFGTALREVYAFSLLSLYFPARDVAAESSEGARSVALAIVAMGLVVALAKVLTFQTQIARAVYAWQVARGRVAFNETLILFPALFASVFSVAAKGRRLRLVSHGVVAILLLALVLTQSRAFWVAFVMGIGVCTLMLNPSLRKAQISSFVVLGITFVGSAYVLLGDGLFLLMLGIFERALSISGSATDDISLVNRFYESREVWSRVLLNPVIGYGPGATYQVYDIIDRFTMSKTFVHNGYLGVWYRFGMIGLGLLLFIWGRLFIHGIQIYRKGRVDRTSRFIALASTACLFSVTASSAASAAFFLPDSIVAFAVVSGLIAGIGERAIGAHR